MLFNPTDPTFIQNPYPLLEQLREQEPIHRSPLGFWFFTRFEDVDTLLHHEGFTHDHQGRMIKRHGDHALEHASIRYLSNSILLQNPPLHTQLRRLMAPFFSPSYFKKTQARLEQTIDAVLSEFSAGESIDFISAIAQPVLGHTICDILGVPEGERSPFLGKTCLSARALDPAAVDPDTRALLDGQVNQVYPYFEQLFERKRATPAEDLISHMVASVDSGQSDLSLQMLIDNCLFLFAAGQEVTKCLMGNALVDLAKYPDQWAWLTAAPERIDDALTEMVRYSTALQMTHRLANRTLEYKGHTIKKGDPVILSLASANRDPSVNEKPDQLDLQRPSKAIRHLSFGRGIHYCIGAHLGSVEMKAIFKRLFQTFPDVTLAEQPLTWQPTITIRGLNTLQLVL